MNAKLKGRLRRATRPRNEMKRLRKVRLVAHRTTQHIYAQLLSPEGSVLAAASSLDKECALTYGGNIAAATAVGKLIAKRAKDVNVDKVAFDRSGFAYHGRIKALADAAREGGLDF